MMKKNNIVLYSIVGLIAITVLSNIIAYPFLPDQVGIHQSAGEMDNYVSKLVFVCLLPAVQIIASIITKMTQKTTLTLVILNVAIVLINAFLIYINV